jgi:hypothetical protein
VPTPNQSERYYHRFRSNPKAHYIRRVSGQPLTVYRPITKDDVTRHLSGIAPALLGVPTNGEGMSFFGVIDLDDHDGSNLVDHAALARRVSNLPLVVCKSTGGKGAWLILFLKDENGFSSATVRQILAYYAAQLGIPNAEIFPKQDRTDNVGNGVNFPYFGNTRIAFDNHGNELDLEGFLKFADSRAAWGGLLAQRIPSLQPRAARPSDDEYPVTTTEFARNQFELLLSRAEYATKNHRHDAFHKAVWFAARATLSGVFEEASVKRRILDLALSKFPSHEMPARRGALRRGWQAGVESGPLLLASDPDFHHPLIADDEIFQRCWDGDTSDFPNAVEAKEYMRQKLEAIGSSKVPRMLSASQIDDAIAHELLLALQLQQLLQNLSSSSST